MNKKLFEQVKSKCKDTGLSEKYLQAITEKMGGSVEDDSTDETAIEEAANLIADIAKESQGEATRWANKQKENQRKNKPNAEGEEPSDDDEPGDDGESGQSSKGKKNGAPKSESEELKEIRRELEELKAERAKGDRAKAISEAMERHKIPSKFRDRLAKSISDDEDVDEAVAAIKQDFITDGLMTEDSGGKKVASEKQVSEAADSLLESITAK
nr:hypothetical protein [uncultured Porphyromonas sp.]